MALETEENVAYPEWTEYRKKNGIDPLGMQTSSQALYQSLVPGISNVTLRARYYGLYAWLARVYATDIRDTNTRSWQRFVRRAEALYALVSQRAGGESGVAGVTWASTALEHLDGELVDFAEAAEPGSEKYYLKQAWGAYGAAYASQLHAIGVYADAREHQIALPSSPIGEGLADAFSAAIGSAAPQFLSCLKDGRVSLSTLDELSIMLPTRIEKEGSERRLYEEILFGHAAIERKSDVSRRQTLTLILSTVEQLGRMPSVLELRWSWYTGLRPDGQLLKDNIPGLSDQRERWWAYQANELTHICYEALLKLTLDELERYPAGTTLRDLIGRIVNRLLTTLPRNNLTWTMWLDAQREASSPQEQALCNDILRSGRPNSAMSDDDAHKVLRLLAIVCGHAQAKRHLLGEVFGSADPGSRAFHSIWTELGFMDELESLPMETALAWLVEKRVLRRHLWVAMRKLRHQGDYTFLIEADDGLIRLKAKDGPVLTNPRLATSLAFLRDIHLISDTGLTNHGKRVVSQA